MKKLLAVNEEIIKNKIFTIRDIQVMLDRDLAKLYEIETKVFNQAVKRNIKRFPNTFRFQLTKNELETLRSQNVTFKENLNTKYLPYVFTEQGVSMLSAVLKSDIAIKISIKIIESFISMRKLITSNISIYDRFERVEQRLSLHDDKFNKIFEAIEEKGVPQKQRIFYDGQIFDAYLFVSDIIKSAKISIKLIDSYVDESTLVLFTKRYENVRMQIYTKTVSKQLKLDLEKHNTQYPKIEIVRFDLSHDRFLIIDEKEVYHFGASLKDLGKKWFAVSKMDINSFEMMEKLK